MAKAKVEAEKQSQAEGSVILQLKQGKERCDEQRSSAWHKMAKAKVEAEKQSQAEGSIILQLKQGKERCDEQRSFSMAQDGKGQN